MYYEKSEGNDRKSAIKRRRDSVMRASEIAMAIDNEEERKNKIQPKLEISQPEDAQEKEADMVARKVVEGGDAQIANPVSASSSVNTKSDGDSTLYADDKLQRQLDSSKGSGQSMDDTTKGEMETKMGADFSGVKIHTDSAAHTMSEDINAKAFTHGQDVYFKNGNYDPGSGAGKELLAHELHHTRQNGGGVDRKVWRQVEDIGSINRQVQEMNLDDFSGLVIQVLGGYVPVYDNLKATESCDQVESGFIIKTGKKVANRYEVIEIVPVNKKTEATGSKTTTETISEKRYVEFGGTEWADMAVLELLPDRLLYRAQANPGNDLSYYKIKVKWKFINLFEDENTKLFSKVNGAKNQELQLLGKNSFGNYPVDITDIGGKVVRKYIRGSVSKNSFDLIGISKDRYGYDANKNRGEISDLSGYQIKLSSSVAKLYPYPTPLVTYDINQIPKGTIVTISHKTGGEVFIYYQVAIDKQSGYVPVHIAASDFEIVSAPTSMGKVKDLDVLSNEADKQAQRNIKLATVDYSKVQNLLQTAAENIGKEISGFNKIYDQMTEAELSVLRGAHRMLILKALMVNKGKKERIIRLLKSTGMEVSGEMGSYLQQEDGLQEKLMTDYASSLEDKKNMSMAIGAAAGKTSYVLDQIKSVLKSDDYSDIDELAYTLSDPDMESLDADTRADIIDKMMIEANYYWHISSDEDDETMVKLVRSAKREDPEDAELLKFKKRIHPNFKDESGNLYTRLVEMMATYCTREYQIALSELYPDDVNNVLLDNLRDKLKESDEEKNADDKYERERARDNRREAASDDVLEWTLQLSHKGLLKLSVAEKLEIIDIALWELEVGGEEETALIQLLAATSAEQYPDLRAGLEETVGGYEFHRLHELVSRIDESGAPDLRRVLNPIMEVDRSKGEVSALIERINKLLAEKNDFAERYMFLLTDNLLEQLSLDERKKMIDESADYWADGTDESVIIRLVNTTPASDYASLYEWFTGKDENGYSNHLNWVQHSVDGSNRDLFMQAVGALKDDKQAVLDAQAGFDYGKGVGSDSKVLESVGLLTNDQMADLTVDERIQYIKYICNNTGIVWVHGENIVTRLIETTPASKNPQNLSFAKESEISQVTILLKRFGENGGELYNQVHAALDDETFDAMQQSLQGLIVKQRFADGNADEVKKEDELIRQQGALHGKTIIWNGPGSNYSSTVGYTSDGQIRVTFSLGGSLARAQEFQKNHPGYTFVPVKYKKANKTKYRYRFTAHFRPDEMIGVMHVGAGGADVDEMLSATQSNMTIDVMPAIGLFQNQVDDERAMREAMWLMLDIILLAVGIGELTMALRGIRLAFAIADVVIGALTIGIKAFRKQLMATEEGRVFLGMVDGITMAYGIVGIGRLTAALYSMGKIVRLRNQLNALKAVAKDAEMLRAMELLVSKLENPGPLYKTLFKISNEGEYKAALDMIDNFPGLMKAERLALKKMADLKLAHPQMGPKAFLKYLEETPEELVMQATRVRTEDDLIKFRQQLDELEAEGKLANTKRKQLESTAEKSKNRAGNNKGALNDSDPHTLSNGKKPTVNKEDLKPDELARIQVYLDNPVPRHFALLLQKPLSTKALRYLSEQMGGIEVGQIFVTASPKGPGQMYVIFGTVNKIEIPDFDDAVYLISHIHPSGSSLPSAADINLLNGLRAKQRALGMPEQTSSQILPSGLKSSKFTPETPVAGGVSKTNTGNELHDPDGLGSLDGPAIPIQLQRRVGSQNSPIISNWFKSKNPLYKGLSGDAAHAELMKDLDAAIGQNTVATVISDQQGRLSIVLQRPGKTNQIVSVHESVSGEYRLSVFEPGYNPSLNPNIKAPLSENGLVPDYKDTPYLHPMNKGKTFTIEMTGDRGADFTAAFQKSKIPRSAAAGYTWHHMDDFRIVNGKPVCTMQLVKTSAHGQKGVTGMAHSGSVAQWKAYYIEKTWAPGFKFYE